MIHHILGFFFLVTCKWSVSLINFEVSNHFVTKLSFKGGYDFQIKIFFNDYNTDSQLKKYIDVNGPMFGPWLTIMKSYLIFWILDEGELLVYKEGSFSLSISVFKLPLKGQWLFDVVNTNDGLELKNLS